jgi:hypothetical protein
MPASRSNVPDQALPNQEASLTRNFAYFLAALSAILAAGPAAAAGPQRVAVFDFESGPGSQPGAGASVSAIVRADIALLPPLASVDWQQAGAPQPGSRLEFSEPVSREIAVDLGRRTGAAYLVAGRFSMQGSDVVLESRIINSDTGAVSEATVRGKPPMALADLVSALSVRIAAIVTGRSDLEAARIWTPAAIRGTQERTDWLIFSEMETARVSAIDGRSLPGDAGAWSREAAPSPGRHQVSVSWSVDNATAEVSFVWDARPATRYEVRSASGPEGALKLWIEDLSAGRPATRVVTGRIRTRSEILIDTRMLGPQ